MGMGPGREGGMDMERGREGGREGGREAGREGYGTRERGMDMERRREGGREGGQPGSRQASNCTRSEGQSKPHVSFNQLTFGACESVGTIFSEATPSLCT